MSNLPGIPGKSQANCIFSQANFCNARVLSIFLQPRPRFAPLGLALPALGDGCCWGISFRATSSPSSAVGSALPGCRPRQHLLAPARRVRSRLRWVGLSWDPPRSAVSRRFNFPPPPVLRISALRCLSVVSSVGLAARGPCRPIAAVKSVKVCTLCKRGFDPKTWPFLAVYGGASVPYAGVFIGPGPEFGLVCWGIHGSRMGIRGQGSGVRSRMLGYSWVRDGNSRAGVGNSVSYAGVFMGRGREFGPVCWGIHGRATGIRGQESGIRSRMLGYSWVGVWEFGPVCWGIHGRATGIRGQGSGIRSRMLGYSRVGTGIRFRVLGYSRVGDGNSVSRARLPRLTRPIDLLSLTRRQPRPALLCVGRAVREGWDGAEAWRSDRRRRRKERRG
jgi:hypothetical protein